MGTFLQLWFGMWMIWGLLFFIWFVSANERDKNYSYITPILLISGVVIFLPCVVILILAVLVASRDDKQSLDWLEDERFYSRPR